MCKTVERVSPVKPILGILLCCALTLPASPARAGGDTAKAVIGGLLGAMIVNGIAQSAQQSAQQDEPAPNVIVRPMEPKIKRPDPKEVARTAEIQNALYKLDFYNGPVDGASGTRTDDAIKRWEIAFKQTPDSKLDAKEFELLQRLAKTGFTNLDDYQSAQKLGLDTFQDYQSFKQGGFETKDQFIAAHKGGFQDKTTYLDAQSMGVSTYDDYVQAKGTEVKHLMEDVQGFVAAYKGDVDLSPVTSSMSALSPVMNGHWEDSYVQEAKKVSTFATTLKGFEAYRKEREETRAKADAEQANEMKQELGDIKRFVAERLKQNVMDQKALTASSDLKTLSPLPNDAKKAEVEKANRAAKEILAKSGLGSAFDAWEKERKEIHSALTNYLATGFFARFSIWMDLCMLGATVLMAILSVTAQMKRWTFGMKTLAYMGAVLASTVLLGGSGLILGLIVLPIAHSAAKELAKKSAQ